MLKRVSMSGFKSFADRVEFDFAPGVTCIVGPNGCGKSNVVDAFKWVMGEQSARSLRGRQMLDMIFNGSSTRKSSGMAQVELVFDNTDRVLGVDRDEVSVTRKLFRSGESEYLICKEPARLKDVKELFLDTGIGANAYAVIEQGKVEALLHSSPLDRRAIFEEAAGISKYKARKREAERKIARTQQNLLRVEDIIEEVEKRLRSVKLQAGKARNFQQYDARLRQLRASYSMAEFHRLTRSVDAIQAQVGFQTDETTRLRTEIDRNEAESAELLARADHLTDSIAACDNRLVSVRSEVTANEERIDAARARIEEQRANLQRAETRLMQERERCAQQGRELKDVQQDAQALQAETHRQNRRIDEVSAREQELARAVTQTQALLEDEKAGLFDLLRRTSQLHNEITSLAKHAESLSGQKGRLSERDAVIATELEAVLGKREALEDKLREVAALIATETERLDQKKHAARALDDERVRLADRLALEKETRSALRSRRQVLHDLQKRMEGVGAGARCILDQKKALQGPEGPLGAVLGLVADVFATDVARARIVEAAIGERDQHLVVMHGEPLLSDPAFWGDLPERTTIICLDRLPPVVNVRDFSDQPGFVASAQSFVRYPAALEMLARNLLGKTVVVDTLANALAMADEDTAGHRFVTLSGEVVEADGRVLLGPPASRAGLISRMTELRSIDEQLEAVEAHIAELADDLNRRSAQNLHLEQVQQELRTSIYELHTARVETNAALENVAEAVRRLTAEQPLIAGEVASLEQELSEAEARSSASKDSLTRLEADGEAREKQVVQYKKRIEALESERAQLLEQLTEARVAAGKLLEKRSAAAERINALRRGIRAAEEGLKAAQQEMADGEERIAESTSAIESCAQRLSQLRAEAERIDARAGDLRHEREQVRVRLEQLAEATKELRSASEAAEQQLHEHQLALHEAGIRREELVGRVREELHLELAELYESYEHNEQDWEAVEAEITELKRKIDRLGNINLDAITEQTELEERVAFLTAQREDLDVSRRQLENLIARLNEESKKRFTEVFYVIRDNFRELFRKLFGGGKADIILEDPDDVLESGIEIMVRPPGKELQSITLLSGGEKSLTAIALLMSIFRSRPSPFAILDEVDAALDEANNDRFNDIVREFLDRSQFIIITHSKRTMTIADQMYGVTMQEAGVSTRVSVRFEQVDEVASPAVA